MIKKDTIYRLISTGYILTLRPLEGRIRIRLESGEKGSEAELDTLALDNIDWMVNEMICRLENREKVKGRSETLHINDPLLDALIEAKHTSKPEVEICDFCGKEFGDKLTLSEHIKEIHEPKPRKVECTFCYGKGAIYNTISDHSVPEHVCPRCHGEGKVWEKFF